MYVVKPSNIICIELWAAVLAAAANPYVYVQYPNECERSHEFARERANVEICEYCNRHYFN